MKKSGFTLIELMGVITILAILSVITVVGVDKLLLNGKEDLYKNQIDIIELTKKGKFKTYLVYPYVITICR